MRPAAAHPCPVDKAEPPAETDNGVYSRWARRCQPSETMLWTLWWLRIAVANSVGTIRMLWQVVVKPALELCMRGEKFGLGGRVCPPVC